MEQYARAYAKINLTIEILGSRSDGYHEIKSVMARLGIFDTITVSTTGDGRVRIKTNLPYLPVDSKNLCYRAADGYFRLSGNKNPGIFIEINKTVPVGAGLGGGSADAAAVITILENMFGKLGKQERFALALSLGADVPFCLEKCPCICEGIGERLTRINSKKTKNFIVIAKNAIKSSTADVYRKYDCMAENKERFSHDAVIRGLENGDMKSVAEGVFNDFEKVVFDISPEVKTLRDKLLELGATSAHMTGAGPVIFGFFNSEGDSIRARNALRKEEIFAYSTYII